MLFGKEVPVDVNLSIDRTGGNGAMRAIGDMNLKDVFIAVPPKGFSAIKYQDIWNEIVNTATGLMYTLDPNATKFTITEGTPIGFAQTVPKVDVEANGYVYRYYYKIELKGTPPVLKGGTSLTFDLSFLTYVERRRGASSEWATVQIADTLSAGFGRNTSVFSINPLYKKVAERLTK